MRQTADRTMLNLMWPGIEQTIYQFLRFEASYLPAFGFSSFTLVPPSFPRAIIFKILLQLQHRFSCKKARGFPYGKKSMVATNRFLHHAAYLRLIEELAAQRSVFTYDGARRSCAANAYTTLNDTTLTTTTTTTTTTLLYTTPH